MHAGASGAAGGGLELPAGPAGAPVADPSPGAGGGGLAERIDHLFRAVAAPDRAGRREYTYREAAEAIRRLTGAAEPPVSPTYLWELRTGRRDNPTLRHLAGLAALFGVPPGYFFDDALSRGLDDELELLVALREPGVSDLARRAAGLSAPALVALAGMADHARRLEGLPPVPAGDPGDRGDRDTPGAETAEEAGAAAGSGRRPRRSPTGRRTSRRGAGPG
jgi:transcriptional regulator with XRE-family HTH domain